MIDMSGRTGFGEEHAMFRDSVRKLFDRVLTPHLDKHEADGIVGREFWLACGESGLLCPTVAPEYGGLGLDFSYNAVVNEELRYAGSSIGLPLHSDIVADYFLAYGSEEQKQRYLPKMVTGECIAAIAMTEPGAGQLVRHARVIAAEVGIFVIEKVSAQLAIDRRWMPAEPLGNPADWQPSILHPNDCFALVEAKLTIAV